MAPNGNRWRVPDRRFRSGYRWTPEGRRALMKWQAIGIGYVILAALFLVTRTVPALVVVTVILIAYAGRRISVNRQPAVQLGSSPPPAMPPIGLKWNPAPGWPVPPPDWFPPPGWQPQPAWPPPPADLQWWSPTLTRPSGNGAHGAPSPRTSRSPWQPGIRAGAGALSTRVTGTQAGATAPQTSTTITSSRGAEAAWTPSRTSSCSAAPAT